MIDTIGTALGRRPARRDRARDRDVHARRARRRCVTFGGLSLLGGARSAAARASCATRSPARSRSPPRSPTGAAGGSRRRSAARCPSAGAGSCRCPSRARSTACCSASASRRSCSASPSGRSPASALPRQRDARAGRRRRVRPRARAAGRCGSLRGSHPAGRPALDRLALEPRLWLGMRRLDAIGLGACAALLGARARSRRRLGLRDRPLRRRDRLAWQQLGGDGVLQPASTSARFPAGSPRSAASNLAWVTRQDRGLDGFPWPAAHRVDPAPAARAGRRARDLGRLAGRPRPVRARRHREPVRGLAARSRAIAATSPARRPPARSAARAIEGAAVVYAFSTHRRELDLRGQPRTRRADRAARAPTATSLYANPALARRAAALRAHRSLRPAAAARLARGPPRDRVLLEPALDRRFATRAGSPATRTLTTARASATTAAPAGAGHDDARCHRARVARGLRQRVAARSRAHADRRGPARAERQPGVTRSSTVE